MVEVHINPQEALSDGPQSLTPTTFAELAWEVREIFDLVGRQNKKKVMNGIRSCFVEK
jgi:3-deoxy-7-phosphoheptulonate synthase